MTVQQPSVIPNWRGLVQDTLARASVVQRSFPGFRYFLGSDWESEDVDQIIERISADDSHKAYPSKHSEEEALTLCEIATWFASEGDPRFRIVLKRAIDIASKLPKRTLNLVDEDINARTVGRIIVRFAEADEDSAIQLARLIEKPYHHAIALLSIAESVMDENAELSSSLVREAVCAADQIDTTARRARVLGKAAGLLGCLDIHQAWQLIDQIGTTSGRACGMAELARQVAPANPVLGESIFGLAIKTAQRVPPWQLSYDARVRALVHIGRCLGKAGIQNARQVYLLAFEASRHLPEHPDCLRSFAMSHLTEVVAEDYLDLALEIAQQVPDRDYQAQSIATIASVISKSDINQALELLYSIGDHFEQARVFPTIVWRMFRHCDNRAEKAFEYLCVFGSDPVLRTIAKMIPDIGSWGTSRVVWETYQAVALSLPRQDGQRNR